MIEKIFAQYHRVFTLIAVTGLLILLVYLGGCASEPTTRTEACYHDYRTACMAIADEEYRDGVRLGILDEGVILAYCRRYARKQCPVLP